MPTKSIKLDTPCELIDVTPLNPLISKCLIKVCYVGNEPNRNKSVITKDVAIKMANSLPGSPIVGFYNEGTKDFEEHNMVIEIKDGRLKFKNKTMPYGFVDLNARVWFQDYIEGDIIRTYLVTEGYLWTGQYPETKRIIEKGNNHSMELDEDSLDGTWSIDNKRGTRFFIVNDAVFANLCILGEKYDPCFEGATITKFSLDDDFNTRLYSLMKEVQKLKGGNLTVDMNEVKTPVEEVQEPIVEEVEAPATEEAGTAAEETTTTEETTETTTEEEAPKTEEEVEDSAAGEEEEEPATEEDAAEGTAADGEEESAADPVEEPAEDENPNEEGNPAQFSLTDFQNLQERYSNLETKFNELQSSFNDMKTSYAALVEFKNTKDREQKQEMIDSFYMLSDADKSDVVTNIDKYSLDEIEAKLSIICVHNKLDLSGGTNTKTNPGTTFNLEEVDEDSESNIPALVSVLRKNRNNET